MKFKKFLVLLPFLFFLSCGIDDGYYDYDYYYNDCDDFCTGVCNDCHYYQSDVLRCESHCSSECRIHGCDDLNTLDCTELVDQLCM